MKKLNKSIVLTLAFILALGVLNVFPRQALATVTESQLSAINGTFAGSLSTDWFARNNGDQSSGSILLQTDDETLVIKIYEDTAMPEGYEYYSFELGDQLDIQYQAGSSLGISGYRAVNVAFTSADIYQASGVVLTRVLDPNNQFADKPLGRYVLQTNDGAKTFRVYPDTLMPSGEPYGNNVNNFYEIKDNDKLEIKYIYLNEEAYLNLPDINRDDRKILSLNLIENDNLPDYYLEKIRLDTINPKIGETVKFSVMLKNLGDLATDSVYLKGKSSNNAAGLSIYSRERAINPNAYYIENNSPWIQSNSFAITKPTYSQPGYYTFTVSVDPFNNVREKNENNNSQSLTIYIQPEQADQSVKGNDNQLSDISGKNEPKIIDTYGEAEMPFSMNIEGVKQTYGTDESFNLTIKALEKNGSLAMQTKGFFMQAYVTKFTEKEIYTDAKTVYGGNAEYNNGSWTIGQIGPFATGLYRLEISLYCGLDESYCAKTYGVARQVTYTYWFKVAESNNQATEKTTRSDNQTVGQTESQNITSVEKKSATEINAYQTKTTSQAKNLLDKVKGKILLQVEKRGEAYYVAPSSDKIYYLKDGPSAYQLMRETGLGISEKDFLDLMSASAAGEKLRKKLTGKIVLRVQARGEAYYINPENSTITYMPNGEAAYKIMREQSLGISNNDLAKIGVTN